MRILWFDVFRNQSCNFFTYFVVGIVQQLSHTIILKKSTLLSS